MSPDSLQILQQHMIEFPPSEQELAAAQYGDEPGAQAAAGGGERKRSGAPLPTRLVSAIISPSFSNTLMFRWRRVYRSPRRMRSCAIML